MHVTSNSEQDHSLQAAASPSSPSAAAGTITAADTSAVHAAATRPDVQVQPDVQGLGFRTYAGFRR